jgi:hypothetical protein
MASPIALAARLLRRFANAPPHVEILPARQQPEASGGDFNLSAEGRAGAFASLFLHKPSRDLRDISPPR